MWLRDESLHDLVLGWWSFGKPAHGTAMYSFSKKLQFVKYKLKRWNRQHFGNLFQEKKNAQSQLDSITRQIRDQGFTEELGVLEAATVKVVEEWNLREKIFWK